MKDGEVLAQLDATDLKLEMAKDQIDFEATKDRFKTDHSSELALESLHADFANFERMNEPGIYPDTELAKREREPKTARSRRPNWKRSSTSRLWTPLKTPWR